MRHSYQVERTEQARHQPQVDEVEHSFLRPVAASSQYVLLLPSAHQACELHERHLEFFVHLLHVSVEVGVDVVLLVVAQVFEGLGVFKWRTVVPMGSWPI